MLSFLKAQFASDQKISEVTNSDVLNLYQKYSVQQVSPKVDLDKFNFTKKVEFQNKNGEAQFKFGVYEYNKKAMELAQTKEQFEELSVYPKFVLEVALDVKDEKITLKELEEKFGVPTEMIKQINEVSKIDSYLINGVISGQLNQDVLLSSFLALAK